MKIKIIKYMLLSIIIISTILLLISLYNIITWKNDNNKTLELNNKLDSYIKKEEIKEETNINNEEIINKSKLDLYQIDFETLESINKDIIAYIKVEGTEISGTIVKGKDNSYYLTHSFDKKYNQAGWPFMHYENNLKDDKNIVLFGHNRLDKTMFGTLSNIFDKKWQEQKNQIIFITKDKKYLLEPFSIYKVKAEDYYIQTHFKNDKDYKDFLSTIKKRSIYNFNNEINEENFILTLSTCYKDNKYRTVLHAKIIETKEI